MSPVKGAQAPATTYINFHVAAKQGNREAFHGRRLMRIEEPVGVTVSLVSASDQSHLDGQLTVWTA